MKKIFLCLMLMLVSVLAYSQYDSTAHLTRLSIETRVEFDFNNNQSWLDPSGASMHLMDTNTFGFTGRYLNFILAGNFGKHVSYFYRQRIIATPGNSSFFDNTDFLTLTYHINDRFALSAGKMAVNVGGYEYDAAPIDVYYYTQFWANIACFQLGLNFSYTDKQKKNTLSLQVTNSPYLYNAPTWQERLWGKGLFAYSLMWNGNFNHFHTLYSINMIERERGCFVGYLALGNKLTFDHWSIYLDYMNRAGSTHKCFSDFSVMSRIDVNVGKGVVLFAKGGYEQNMSEDFAASIVKDIMVAPGGRFGFGGIGMEYRPLKYQDVRLHAYVVYRNTQFVSDCYEELTTNWNANVGVTWDINFLHYINKWKNKRLEKSSKENN